jgi:hypothetical protein
LGLANAGLADTRHFQLPIGLIPFQNISWREDEPQTVQGARQGEADKVTDDVEME